MKDQAILYPPGANDECHTPDYAVRALIPHLSPGLTYWCPFDEETSEFPIQMRAANLRVVATHIRNGKDFWETYPFYGCDAIVSNPPFTHKAQIFELVLSFNLPFALLMSLTWLNDSAPKRLFERRPLELLMFRERIQYKGQERKITFSSAYYCSGLLPKPIMFDSLKKYGMGQ